MSMKLLMSEFTPYSQQEIETESELEEERVPTPEVMKKEDEDLDTDQVKSQVQSKETTNGKVEGS